MVNISATDHDQSAYFRNVDDSLAINVDDSKAVEDLAITHTGRQCCYPIAETYQAIRKMGPRRVCKALVTGGVVGTTLGGTTGLAMAYSSKILVSASVGVGVTALSSMIFSALCLRMVYIFDYKADSETQKIESTTTTQPQSQSQLIDPENIAPRENDIKTQQATQGEGSDNEREVPPPTYCQVMGYHLL